MGKSFNVSTFTVIILLILTGCKSKSLELSGNIINKVTVTKSSELNALLRDIRYENIFIEGDNGVAALISSKTADKITIDKKGSDFSAVSEGLPPVCNIKNIAGISVYSSCFNNEIRIFDGEKEVERLTPFNYMMKEFEFLGQSSKNGHKAKKFRRIENYNYNWMKQDSVIVITEKETNVLIHKKDFDKITFDGIHLNYDNEKIIGIWMNPPKIMENLITDFENELVNNHLMVILIDGLGYKYLEENTSASQQFKKDFNFMPVLSAYPSKTRKNSWVMMSGLDKKEEGRRVLEDFEIHDSILIEGDQVYNASAIPMLQCTDMDKDGYIDEEIFETAKAAIRNNPEFIFVHFHSFDDYGHRTGAYSHQRDSILALNYKYVKYLDQDWSGEILLVSDHGMHTQNDGKGTHGSLLIEDMLAIKGEKK